ncbi:MAG: hypothetical protein NTW67_03475 [Candidatus Woesearchaeota archaeon]|nr:hypothetical protein [Candidatus Woesearchaeota archaeon]
MRYTILIAVLCLGILIGVTIFTQPEIRGLTGSAALNCYANNELCDCDEKECKCGNITIPKTFCDSQTS